MEDKIANAVVNAISENNSLLMLLVGAFGMFWLVDKVFFYVTKFGKDNGGNGSDPAHVVREVAESSYQTAQSMVLLVKAADSIDRSIEELSRESRENHREVLQQLRGIEARHHG